MPGPRTRYDLSDLLGLSADAAAHAQGLGPKAYATWRHLADRRGQKVCRSCMDEHLRAAGTSIGQMAGTIKDLRNKGYRIPKGVRINCPTHGSRTADQLLELGPCVADSRLRWNYTPKERRKMIDHCGAKDAFDGDRSQGAHLELDHRVPMLRATGDEERIDPDDPDAVRATFMGLTRVHNLRKSRACEECVDTGIRPPSIGGIHFWYEGDATYDEAVGCRGCPWAYPEQWSQELDDIVSRIPPTTDAQV